MRNKNETRICPRCGKAYAGLPALSRYDNETAICPECGLREALEDAGWSAAKQDEVVKAIKQIAAQ